MWFLAAVILKVRYFTVVQKKRARFGSFIFWDSRRRAEWRLGSCLRFFTTLDFLFTSFFPHIYACWNVLLFCERGNVLSRWVEDKIWLISVSWREFNKLWWAEKPVTGFTHTTMHEKGGGRGMATMLRLRASGRSACGRIKRQLISLQREIFHYCSLFAVMSMDSSSV